MDTGTVIALATLGLAIVGAIVAAVLRFGKVEAAAADARAAAEAAEAVRADLANFKVEVARDYATAAMVTAVVSRVEVAIDRLGDRLDRFLEARPAAARTRKTPL